MMEEEEEEGEGGGREEVRDGNAASPSFLTLTTRFFPSDTLRATTGIFFPTQKLLFL
jgi:hypothetical protein